MSAFLWRTRPFWWTLWQVPSNADIVPSMWAIGAWRYDSDACIVPATVTLGSGACEVFVANAAGAFARTFKFFLADKSHPQCINLQRKLPPPRGRVSDFFPAVIRLAHVGKELYDAQFSGMKGNLLKLHNKARTSPASSQTGASEDLGEALVSVRPPCQRPSG